MLRDFFSKLYINYFADSKLKSNESFLVLLLQIVQIILLSLSVIFIARILPTSLFGQYVYYLTISSIISLAAGFGGENILLMHGSRDQSIVSSLFSNAILIRVLLSILAFTLVSLFMYFNKIFSFWSFNFILLGSLISYFSNPLFLAFYRVNSCFTRPWILSFFYPVTFLLYLIFVPKRFENLEIVSLGFLLSQLLTFYVFFADMRGRFKFKISYSYFKKYKNASFVFSMSQMFDYVFSRLDIFLIKFLLGSYSVGIYAAGQRVVSFFQLIPSSLNVVELPDFHRISSDALLLRNKFRRLRIVLVELSFFLFGIIILLSKDVITIIFGESYNESTRIMILLSISSIALFISYPYSMLAESINKINGRLADRVITCIFTILAIWYLGSRFGISGVALGVILSHLFYLVLLHILTREANGGWLYLFADLKSGIISLPAVVMGFYIQRILVNAELRLTSVAISYMLFYYLVSKMLGFNKELLQLLSKLVREIFSFIKKIR